MSIKEYLILHIVIGCLTVLVIQTVQVLKTPLKQNIEMSMKQGGR